MAVQRRVGSTGLLASLLALVGTGACSPRPADVSNAVPAPAGPSVVVPPEVAALPPPPIVPQGPEQATAPPAAPPRETPAEPEQTPVTAPAPVQHPPDARPLGPVVAANAGPVAAPILYSQSSPARKLDSVPDGKDPWLACDAALDWLMRHQAEDGSWSGAKPGVRCTETHCASRDGVPDVIGDTALAVTALCATGWGKPRVLAIRTGVAYLLSAQGADGTFSAPSASNRVLDQALATEALCRSLEKKSSADHRDAAKRAAMSLLSMRTPGAAWSDGGAAAPGDLRVTTWATMALADARSVEVQVPDEVYRDVLSWLDTEPGGRSVEAAVLRTCCRLFCGTSLQDPRLLADHAVLKESGEGGGGDGAALDPTGVYFANVAGFYWGGDVWSRRRTFNFKVLVPLQHGEGDGCLVGSWDPDGTVGKGGSRVVSTALFSMLYEATYISTYRNAIGGRPLIPK